MAEPEPGRLYLWLLPVTSGFGRSSRVDCLCCSVLSIVSLELLLNPGHLPTYKLFKSVLSSE